MSLSELHSTQASSRINVFVVDDYHLTRMGLIAALKQFSSLHFVGEAESAEEALLKLSCLRPNVVIVDLGLPGMNGIELAETIRTQWPKIRMIVLTSHSSQEAVLGALAAGAHAYMLKDNSPQTVYEVIEMVNEGAMWLDPYIASVVLDMLNAPATREAHNRKNKALTGQSFSLSASEIEILRLIVDGKTNPQIANILCLSVATISTRVRNIFQKLSVDDRVKAAVKALKEYIV